MNAHQYDTAAAPRRTRSEPNARGWFVFAAVMMLVLGGLDALWGLAAVLNNEVVVVGGHGVIVADISTWGWINLILGVALILTGLGLLGEVGAARWAAIFLIALGAILQLPWFTAAPLWTLLIIALSVVLIYQLTVNWAE
jgi:hypothetical protein